MLRAVPAQGAPTIQEAETVFESGDMIKRRTARGPAEPAGVVIETLETTPPTCKIWINGAPSAIVIASADIIHFEPPPAPQQHDPLQPGQQQQAAQQAAAQQAANYSPAQQLLNGLLGQSQTVSGSPWTAHDERSSGGSEHATPGHPWTTAAVTLPGAGCVNCQDLPNGHSYNRP